MANTQVALIGLGAVSASMGLALRAAQQDLTLVGTDRDWSLAGRMKELGAVDRIERTPAAACKDAGLIIIHEPINDIATIFQNIADVLLPGCVVTDTAPLKVDVMRWAKQSLPDTVSFIGGHPLLLADVGDQPRVKLFSGIQYGLIPADSAQPQAVSTVSTLVELIGAHPYFPDAAEHDGLMAAVEGLPWLLQVALLSALGEAGSWRDNQRAASRPFIHATSALGDAPQVGAYTHWLNRQNLVRWLDLYQGALAQLRTSLTGEDEAAFQTRVEALYETRQKWIRERETGDWDSSVPPVKIEKRGGLLSQLLWPGGRPSKES